MAEEACAPCGGVDAQAKRAMRAAVRARLLALPPARRALEEELVTAAVQGTPEWRAAGTVLLYRSVAPELSTVGLANAAWRTGKRVLFPRVGPGGGLTLHAVASWSGFEAGPLGIPQPPPTAPVAPGEADLAIVPGVAWDAGGGRLGRGGGHYDRLLPALRRAWGVGFSAQVVPAVPREAHDRRVERVFAPSLFPLET
jgi:5-formyltetrahydrofolate cyclo-ligase